MITEIIDKLGEKAVVNVEDSKTFVTDYEIVDGYEAGVGFISPRFITDVKGSKAVYENILFYLRKKISNLIDISPLLNCLKKKNLGQIQLVCDDIDDTMLRDFCSEQHGV